VRLCRRCATEAESAGRLSGNPPVNSSQIVYPVGLPL